MIQFNLEKILQDKNISIYRLAEDTSITYSALHRIVNNKTNGIQFNTLEEIMNALDIKDFNEILEFIPEDSKEE